jgi:hypothetical protein
VDEEEEEVSAMVIDEVAALPELAAPESDSDVEADRPKHLQRRLSLCFRKSPTSRRMASLSTRSQKRSFPQMISFSYDSSKQYPLNYSFVS